MNPSPVDAVRSFVSAINERNTARLLDLMTPDHSLIDSLGVAIQGHDKLRIGWDSYFRMVPDYSITVDEIYSQDSVVVMLGTASGTYSPDGILSVNNRWSTPAAWRVVVSGSKIKEWRVYADNEPIRRRMAAAKR